MVGADVKMLWQRLFFAFKFDTPSFDFENEQIPVLLFGLSTKWLSF